MKTNQQIIEEFKNTGTQFIAALKNFTEDEINIIPAPGKWSPAQFGRHIYKAIEFMPQLLSGKVEKTQRSPDEKIVMLENIFLNFGINLQAPEFIQPEEKIYTCEEIVEPLQQKVHSIIETALPMDLSFTCMGFELPKIGHLTRYECIYFAIVHIKRHIHQLQSIKEVLNETT